MTPGMLAACLLPWREDFTLDSETFRRHIQYTIQQGYNRIYLMGTAGEGHALTDFQFRQVVAIFNEETNKPGLVPMIGVISPSMGQVIERIRFAFDLGVREFQISLPGWGALTDAEMTSFFVEVCGAFPNAYFLHYNTLRGGRLLSGADYRAIADRVPNLVATKNSTSDYARVADLMTHVPDLQHFFVENAFAFGCLFGECSMLCSYGLLFPKLDRQLYTLGSSGQFGPMMELHKLVNGIGNILWRGGLRGSRIDGAYDKIYAWLRDPSFPLRLLPPYRGFSEAEAALVRKNFEADLAHLE